MYLGALNDFTEKIAPFQQFFSINNFDIYPHRFNNLFIILNFLVDLLFSWRCQFKLKPKLNLKNNMVLW